MKAVLAPSQAQALEYALTLCNERKVIERLGVQADMLTDEIRSQISDLFPRFVLASGALPAIGRRAKDTSLWIQGEIPAHELPPLETDHWHAALHKALNNTEQDEVGENLIECAIIVRRSVFDALHALFTSAIAEACGGILS